MTTTTSTTSSTSAASIVSTLGTGSGIDIKALATNLMEAEKTPAKAVIDKKVAASTANISGYAAIKYVLDTLKTAFSDLKDQSDFNAITPTNSQPSALSISAGATATTGNHSISITSLAKPQRNISAGFATGNTTLNGGVAFNLSLSVHGGAAQTIAVTDTTPTGVAIAINKAGLGVTAQIIKTGDATAPYKIMLTGTSGAANDFTLSSDNLPAAPTVVTTQGDSTTASPVTESSQLTFGSGVTAGQSLTVGGLTYTAAQDASAAEVANAFASLAVGATTGAGTAKGSYSGALTGFSTGANTNNTVTAISSAANSNVTDLRVSVSGLSFASSLQTASNAALNVDGVDITSSSNQVQDAISGVTLNLSGLTSGTATLNFTRDTTAVKTKIQALVTAYNDANSMLTVVSDSKSTVTDYGASLVGNSIVGQIRSQIRAMVIGDSSSPSGGINAMRDLGVSIDKTGVLQLDATKLDTTLNSNFDNAVTMLSANRENLSTYSTWTAGVAGDAVKKLTALLANTGTLTTQSANATSKIKSYNDDLAKLETRMASLLARYNKQFAAMDSIVGQTKSVAAGLTSTFAGMMAAYTNK